MHDLQAARDEALSPDTGASAARRHRTAVLAICAAIVVVLDQATKWLVVERFHDGSHLSLLGGRLLIEETRNPGAAFGIAGGATVLFTLVAAVVVVVIARTARRLRSTVWAFVLGLLLGGAVGNLLDRVFREPGLGRGHVVDWIDFRVWPVFNLADTAIVVGGVLAVLLAGQGVGVDGTRESKQPRRHT